MANKIVRKETTTVVKEFDKKGRVVRETTTTDTETYGDDPLKWTYPYTFTDTSSSNVKLG
jgi:hypothetical protein